MDILHLSNGSVQSQKKLESFKFRTQFYNLGNKNRNKVENRKHLRLKCDLLVAVNFYIKFAEDMIKLILIFNTHKDIKFGKYKISQYSWFLAKVAKLIPVKNPCKTNREIINRRKMSNNQNRTFFLLLYSSISSYLCSIFTFLLIKKLSTREKYWNVQTAKLITREIKKTQKQN